MTNGTVTAIYIAPKESAPVEGVEEVLAVAGRGLEGDRYYDLNSNPGHPPKDEITLIESENLEEAEAKHSLGLAPGGHRRNIVTSGVRLRELIGKTFYVGDVRVEALEDNPPCRHLAELAGVALVKPLIDGGGVRGRILDGGTIRTGDPIRL